MEEQTPPHAWEPLKGPHAEPAIVPQHVCTNCGLCRAQPNPADPTEVAHWYPPVYPGAPNHEPTEAEPTCWPIP